MQYSHGLNSKASGVIGYYFLVANSKALVLFLLLLLLVLFLLFSLFLLFVLSSRVFRMCRAQEMSRRWPMRRYMGCWSSWFVWKYEHCTPFDEQLDDLGPTSFQNMQSCRPKCIQTGVATSVSWCRRASNCLVLMSCTQHRKVEVFRMWWGPRDVTMMAHTEIWDIGPVGLCENMSIASF